LITWSGEGDPVSGQALATDEQRGRDAVRFFLVSRRADSEFVFDVDLALSKSEDNPVYYVQYAHARICSVLAQALETRESVFVAFRDRPSDSLETLIAPREQALLNRLSEFPDVINNAASELSPHLLAFYLRELAADFHGFYNSERVLVDDPSLRSARLLLLAATGQTLGNGLSLLGVSAPNRM
jgi:arginyl-tRNA synthetase